MEKNRKKYRIADISFEMSCSYPYTEKLCADYETETPEEPLFEIEVSEAEIAKEKSVEANQFSEAYLESLAVYRKLCKKMLDYDTFLFHGSAVAVDGKAYLFTAPSGTGKSTHTRLWRQYFGERAVMVNDDKPLLQVREDAVYVCGTPWCGKHGLQTNVKMPIHGICILRQGAGNKIRSITAMEAYPELYRQTYRPAERSKMIKTLSLLKQLAERVPMYWMECTISEEAAEMAWNEMKAK